MSAPTYTIGEIVRLVQARGHVTKAQAGRLVTVRALGTRDPDCAVRVDDGDPSNPDLLTNGFRSSMWLPLAAIEPLAAEVRRG